MLRASSPKSPISGRLLAVAGRVRCAASVSTAGGGVPSVQSFQQPPRYILQFFVQAQNLANRANYVGYSGTLSSPLFGQPTAVQSMRKIDIGLNFNF